MTAIQHLNAAGDHGRSRQALRRSTRALRLVGDHVGRVTVVALAVTVLAGMVNDIVEFAPVLNLTSGVEILLILAGWGAARVIEEIAYDVADRIDPDLRDGDDLWDATQVLQANAAALAEGANYDHVRRSLQASQVLPALHGLTEQLRDDYAKNDEMQEASALSDTAALIRAAAQSFGHHDCH
ncbi:hypothetical protein AR457_41815 (plasmid) [Streptomyces agglomeratus]|uniref:hypothetical protein n=1 Tax=Streptomyces agglomeratus TaxID=285458 RepID=UPI0008540D7D|nr:hypothetical protein [Streptomyces agglomeratus]OEJ20811.1 hypothetical protein AR457_41815 [Streptomyces agglomeratus]